MIKVNVNLLKSINPINLVKIALFNSGIFRSFICLKYENISLILIMILIASYMSMMALYLEIVWF